MNQFPPVDPLRLASFSQALGVLELGLAYAGETQEDPWQFAVPIRHLLSSGLTEVELRWLLDQRLVGHDFEAPIKGTVRSFASKGSNRLDLKQSSFVLKKAGQRFVVNARRRMDQLILGGELRADAIPPLNLKPHWDEDNRELYWHAWIVKKYVAYAELQERILQWYQIKEWVERIPDDFSEHPGCNPQERLHNAISGLNRAQTACKIQFYRDGTKTSICWRKV